MGVQGLWQLLESTGRPVTLESLEGKVLAVDVSIWLNQAMRGMRDDQGNVATNAHLLVLFNRICKLLFYRIKPIFVFDGGVPQLKKQTLVARRQRRELAASKSKRTADKMLKNYMQTHALHAVMGGNKQKGSSVPKLGRISSQEPDLFQLPPMPESSEVSQEDGDQSVDTWEESQGNRADFAPYVEDTEKMDIDSEVFRALPLEIQHELITEMKEKGKKNSWKKIAELPKQAGDFSSYQISKLLNKGKMTQRLDQLRKEMNVQNTGAVASMLDYENSLQELHAGRIMSEDTEHYVLVKNKPKNTDEKENENASKASSGGDQLVSSERLEGKSQGTAEGSVNVDKSQSTGSAPWDIDLTLPGEDAPVSPDKSKEITEAVKSFFSKNKIQSTQQRNLDLETVVQSQRGGSNCKSQASTLMTGQSISGSKDNEVVVLSDNDGSISPSADDIEIIGVKQGKQKNLQSFFSTAIDKLVHSALSEQKEADEKSDKGGASNDVTSSDTKDKPAQGNLRSSNEDDVMIVDEIEASASLGDVKVTKVVDDLNKQQVQPHKSQNKLVIPMMSTLLDKLVADALSQETETRSSQKVHEVFDSSEKVKVMSKEDVKRKEVGTISVSADSDESDDDFIEVPFHQVSTKEELFPPETFTPSVSVSKASSDTPSLVLNDKESDAVNTDAAVEEKEEEEEKEEKEGESENGETEDSDSVDEDEVAMETSDVDSQEVQRQEAVEEWAGMNVANTSELQSELESERLVLATERRKQERVAVSITDVMYAESKELLQLFGLPFIVSPQEAEAQCAYLDLTHQTQGTITDDSDVWLFGGCSVYKNFFTKGKDVEFFRNADFERELMLTREKLIQLAYLLGSDYTEGIQGVGWVTAMEVLSEFPGDNLDGLKNFKEWWDKAQKQLMPPVESVIRSKLRKLTLYPGFPNPHVREAYLKPVIDESQEEFSWGSPDLDLLRDFASDKFGWNRSKSDETLLPVLRKLNEKRVQSKINHFFPMEHHEPKKIKSKRLRRVLRKLSNPNMESEDSANDEQSSKRKRGRPSKKKEMEGEMDNSEVKGQEKSERTGRKSKQAKKSNSTDGDVSDEYVPPTKVSNEVKGQSRSSGRISKKVVYSADLENPDVEEEEGEMTVPNLSTVGGVAGEQSRGANGCAKGATGATEGKGTRGVGNKGRGKGRVGVKGKGKLLAKKGRGRGHVGKVERISGPKLSESSSGDSD